MKRAQMRSDRKNILCAVLFRRCHGVRGVAIWYRSGVFRVYEDCSIDMYRRFDWWQIAEQYISDFSYDISIVVPNYQASFMVVSVARNWLYSYFSGVVKIGTKGV